MALSPPSLLSTYLKLGTVNGLATSAVFIGEVASLDHELRYDAVERGALEMEWLAGLANTLLASAQRAKVVHGLRHNVAKQSHYNSACAVVLSATLRLLITRVLARLHQP